MKNECFLALTCKKIKMGRKCGLAKAFILIIYNNAELFLDLLTASKWVHIAIFGILLFAGKRGRGCIIFFADVF